jgi:hypothetical protein
MRRRISKRKRRLLAAIILGVIFLSFLLFWAINSKSETNNYVPGDSIDGLTSELKRNLPAGYPKVTLVDVTEQSGIHFQHFGDIRTTQLPEDMGSGCAWGDYDNDGWQDVFIANFSGSLGDKKVGSKAGDIRSHLYHNNQDGTFTEMSTVSGLELHAFANAGAWGDFNNDGWLDLFVSAFGKNFIFQNLKDGHFKDISGSSGISMYDGYWAGIALSDYNRDGHLDIYVCGYVDYQYSSQASVSRQYNAEVPASINPSSFNPIGNLLFQNNGNGSFSEVAKKTEVANEGGKSLEAAWCDFDNDGWPDLYVANDVSDNALYRNKGDGTFEDVSYNSFVADYRGAMGIGIGDWDNDQDFDMMITHWMAQENALYVNLRSQLDLEGLAAGNRIKFMDQADRFGLGQIALEYVGFSTFFFDYDNDSRKDLFVANGSTFQKRENQKELVPMKDQLFWNKGNDDGFFDVSAVSGSYFKETFVGRGAACADYDNDGDLDVLVVNNGGTARLLRNDGGNTNNWIQLSLKQSGENTNAIGALVRLVAGDVTQVSQVGTQGPYFSQNSLVEHFGTGERTKIDTLEITWPDGKKETLHDISVNQKLILTNNHE